MKSNNRLLLVAAPALFLLIAGSIFWMQREQALPNVVVYKSPTCGCCSKWVDHMRQAGFQVETHDVNDLPSLKSSYGVGGQVASCHTAVVDGYVVEGHVPAVYVQRLLKERPAVAGLAVPGMPMGSPGMEGTYAEPYDVLAFDRAGNTTVYAHVEAR